LPKLIPGGLEWTKNKGEIFSESRGLMTGLKINEEVFELLSIYCYYCSYCINN
jgi:hypothetical protein